MDENKDKRDALLARLGIDYKAVFVPQSASRNSAETMPSLNWRVTLKRRGHTFATDYMQGIGHVPRPASFHVPGDARLWERDERAKSAADGKYVKGAYRFDGAFNLRVTLPAPALADVLYCLLSDGEATEYGFEEWCANFGYDADSRKAEKTYYVCVDTGRALERLFTGDALRELRDAFTDY